MISLPLFKQETFQALCTVHCALPLSVECWVWKIDDRFPMPCLQSLQVTLLHSRSCWAFSLEELLFWFSFCQAMKAGGTNVLDIYEGLSNCRPEDKPLIICPPAHAGSVSAARAASCAVPDMCRKEKNVLEKLQVTAGEKWMNSALLFWFTVLGAVKDIKMTESHPCCTFEQISGRNSSTVRRPHWGFSRIIQSKAFQCEKHETAHPFLCKLLAEKNGPPQTGLKHHSASSLSPFWPPLQAVNLFISCWFQVYKQTFRFFSLGNCQIQAIADLYTIESFHTFWMKKFLAPVCCGFTAIGSWASHSHSLSTLKWDEGRNWKGKSEKTCGLR